MSVQIDIREHEGGVIVLSIHGDVDMSSSSEVREHLSPLIRPDKKAIIVNLSDVAYMDSSGIATMVDGLQQSMKKGVHFRLAELSRTVLEVFKLARLESVFKIYPTTADAMSDL